MNVRPLPIGRADDAEEALPEPDPASAVPPPEDDAPEPAAGEPPPEDPVADSSFEADPVPPEDDSSSGSVATVRDGARESLSEFSTTASSALGDEIGRAACRERV